MLRDKLGVYVARITVALVRREMPVANRGAASVRYESPQVSLNPARDLILDQRKNTGCFAIYCSVVSVDQLRNIFYGRNLTLTVNSSDTIFPFNL